MLSVRCTGWTALKWGVRLNDTSSLVESGSLDDANLMASVIWISHSGSFNISGDCAEPHSALLRVEMDNRYGLARLHSFMSTVILFLQKICLIGC